MNKYKPLTHEEAIRALVNCASTVTVLSYREVIEGYFRLRDLEIPSTQPKEYS
jgi:hypothetical protein